VNAFDMPDFTPLAQRKFDEAALDAFPREESFSRFGDVPQRVRLITLDALFPPDAALAFFERLVQIIRVGDKSEIVVRGGAFPFFASRAALRL
jgi:hypothetical protein